ncbi:MAG: hypothetical protein ABIG44_11310 [Planctomycetota bacterium]
MISRMVLPFLLVTLLLCPLGAAFAQGTEDQKPDTPGHLEYPSDPYLPAPSGVQRTSPSVVVSRDGNVSVQVNISEFGFNIVGDAANEPSLAIDPTNPNRMVIGWRQFDNVNSNFRQAGWAYTANGGQNWIFPGVIEPGVFRSDPVLDADANGNFYYNSLTANTAQTDFWCHVYISTDGGQTFDAGHYAYGGDKQWQCIDTTGGMGNGHIYASWNRYYSACNGDFTRSTDGGFTFENCINILTNPYWGTLAVGPDGELYISGQGFVVVKSSTAKNPLQSVTWDFATSLSLGGSIGYSAGPNPGGLLGQVWVATDHSGGPTHGNVYMLCSVDPGGVDPLDVMFARSTDGGQSWSAPVRVNDVQAGWQWFGTMSVAPNGRIDAVWLDTRNDPGGYDSELYYSYSEDAGQTWSPNEALSPAFDPHVGWPQQNKMGDYFDMISDNDGVHLAYAATFNGEQDVYYINITRNLSISFPNGLPSLLTPGEATDITVRINEGNEQYIADSGTLYYRYDEFGGGQYDTAPLTPLGDDLYLATLPAAGCDDQPEFYFSATGTVSGIVYSPATAPTAVYTAEVGEYEVVLEYDFETGTGWTVENSGLTDGQWDRGIPVNCNRGDPPSDYDGSGQCFLTDNSAADACNSDVDGGYTWLLSPTIDLSTGDAQISYAVWYNNSYGGDPNNDLFVVWVSNNNGGSWVEAETLGPASGSGWSVHSFQVADFVTPTAQVKVRFEASDLNAGSVVEAGIDAFRVERFGCEEGDTAVCCHGYVCYDVNPNDPQDPHLEADCLAAGGTYHVGVSCTDSPCDCGGTDYRGDADCLGDGPLSYDIDHFILAIGAAGDWIASHGCNYFCANDINCDGSVDSYDIDWFITCVGVGTCDACP